MTDSQFMTLSDLRSAEWPRADWAWRPVLFYRPTKLLTNPQPDQPVATILSVISVQTAASLAALPNAADLAMPGELFLVVPDGTPWPAVAVLIAQATSQHRLGAVYIDAHGLSGNVDTSTWDAFSPV